MQTSMKFNVGTIRRQFPILKRKVSGQALIYLDNAATTHKPRVVLESLVAFYSEKNGNVHRGFHPLAEAATEALEDSRKVVAKFLSARFSHEIIFTKNATEAINLVARSFGTTLKPGDEIALSMMEHHSNIVPWFQLNEAKKTKVRWIPIDPEGTLDFPRLEKFLSSGKVRLLSITGLSNVLGCLPPLKKLSKIAHAHGSKILIDAAQLAGHAKIDVQDIDADFLVFSGHKIYGPNGTGVLYAKEKILEELPPFLGGGGMIQSVTTEGFIPAELPRKFEAGTPAVADIVGLGEAVKWFWDNGQTEAFEHMQALIEYAHIKLSSIPSIRILGPSDPKKRSGNVSFAIKGVHPHDLTEILGRKGICLRAGHHCTQPLHKFLGINASTRLSVGIYNTKEEIDVCVEEIKKAVKLLNG